MLLLAQSLLYFSPFGLSTEEESPLNQLFTRRERRGWLSSSVKGKEKSHIPVDPQGSNRCHRRHLMKQSIRAHRAEIQKECKKHSKSLSPKPPWYKDAPKPSSSKLDTPDKSCSKDFSKFQESWLTEFSDIFGPVPEVLPPFREVNHEINLIDPNKKLSPRTPRCAEVLRPELNEKVTKYVHSGWWIPCNTPSASPMLCIRKKTGKLRTAIDCRERNDNTEKDVTPFPDQDLIRNDVPHAPFRSKLDMTDTYEQVRVIPEHVD
jgi:hypothetical protein